VDRRSDMDLGNEEYSELEFNIQYSQYVRKKYPR